MSFARGNWGTLTEYMDSLEKDKAHAYTVDYSSGKPRNAYPIGVSILVMPAVIIKSWLDPDFERELENGVPDTFEEFLASMIGAAAAVVFFWVLIEQFQLFWIAAAGTAIFSFGTSMWSTATRALFQHGPLVLMLTIAMLLAMHARRRPSLIQYMGLPIAAAYTIRPTAMVAVAAFTVYVFLFHRRWFLQYLGWAALIAVPWIAFNYAVYGVPVPPYYLMYSLGTVQQASFTNGLLGLLFSPSRGLFIFTPVMFFALSGFVLSLRRREERPLHVMYGTLIVGMTCLYSLWPNWWGGHSFGPRFMTDLLPFLAFFVVFNFSWALEMSKVARSALLIAIAILAVIGGVIHGRGAAQIGPYVWNNVPRNVDEDPSRLWDWGDPQFLRKNRNPTTSATEYFGGIEIIMCT